eukprot:1462874-Rhodomonas_salina.1
MRGSGSELKKPAPPLYPHQPHVIRLVSPTLRVVLCTLSVTLSVLAVGTARGHEGAGGDRGGGWWCGRRRSRRPASASAGHVRPVSVTCAGHVCVRERASSRSSASASAETAGHVSASGKSRHSTAQARRCALHVPRSRGVHVCACVYACVCVCACVCACVCTCWRCASCATPARPPSCCCCCDWPLRPLRAHITEGFGPCAPPCTF